MDTPLDTTLDTLMEPPLDTPQPAPLHALYLEVADRAQEVAWQAYLQDRRPASAGPASVAAGTGVLDAYARLGTAVERLLDTLAERGQFADHWRETRHVTVTFCGACTLRIRAYREPNRHRGRLRIVLDASTSRRAHPRPRPDQEQPDRKQTPGQPSQYPEREQTRRETETETGRERGEAGDEQA